MYTIQYFIDKFSAIPEDQWCSDIQVNEIGQRCAYGHTIPLEQRGKHKNGSFYGCNALMFPEGQALTDLGNKYFPESSFQFAGINNGDDPRFQQPTEKQRVLAALQWCKEQEAQRMITTALAGPDEEEDEDDEEEYRYQKMKEDHPGHSEEAYRTGEKLGVGFPYVPGDPFW